jgi:hypothetical protein
VKQVKEQASSERQRATGAERKSDATSLQRHGARSSDLPQKAELGGILRELAEGARSFD